MVYFMIIMVVYFSITIYNAEQSQESDFKVSWFLGEKKPREEEVVCYQPIGRATRYRNLPSTTLRPSQAAITAHSCPTSRCNRKTATR